MFVYTFSSTIRTFCVNWECLVHVNWFTLWALSYMPLSCSCDAPVQSIKCWSSWSVSNFILFSMEEAVLAEDKVFVVVPMEPRAGDLSLSWALGHIYGRASTQLSLCTCTYPCRLCKSVQVYEEEEPRSMWYYFKVAEVFLDFSNREQNICHIAIFASFWKI